MAEILLALTVSVDAFAVGLSFGVRRVKIRPLSALVICAFSVLYAAAAVSFGEAVVRAAPEGAAKCVGGAVLCAMGLYAVVFRGLRAPKMRRECEARPAEGSRKTVFRWAIASLGITVCILRDPRAGDANRSGSIELGEALALGLALSVDVLGAGVGIAMTGDVTPYFPPLVGVAQVAFLCAGRFLGGRLGGRLSERAASVASGLVLVAVGILKML